MLENLCRIYNKHITLFSFILGKVVVDPEPIMGGMWEYIQDDTHTYKYMTPRGNLEVIRLPECLFEVG